MHVANESAPPTDQSWQARAFGVFKLNVGLIVCYKNIWRPVSSVRHEEAASSCGKDLGIEMRTGGVPKLVHPEIRLGRQVAVPPHARTIEEVDVPGIAWNRQDLLVHPHR